MIEDLRKEKKILREKLLCLIREENTKNAAAVTFRISDFFFDSLQVHQPYSHLHHTLLWLKNVHFRFY